MEQLLPLPNPILRLILILLHGKARYFIPMGALGLHMALEQFKCIYAGMISCDQQWDCSDAGLLGNLWDEANQQDLPGHAQPLPIPQWCRETEESCCYLVGKPLLLLSLPFLSDVPDTCLLSLG